MRYMEILFVACVFLIINSFMGKKERKLNRIISESEEMDQEKVTERVKDFIRENEMEQVGIRYKKRMHIFSRLDDVVLHEKDKYSNWDVFMGLFRAQIIKDTEKRSIRVCYLLNVYFFLMLIVLGATLLTNYNYSLIFDSTIISQNVAFRILILSHCISIFVMLNYMIFDCAIFKKVLTVFEAKTGFSDHGQLRMLFLLEKLRGSILIITWLVISFHLVFFY